VIGGTYSRDWEDENPYKIFVRKLEERGCVERH